MQGGKQWVVGEQGPNWDNNPGHSRLDSYYKSYYKSEERQCITLDQNGLLNIVRWEKDQGVIDNIAFTFITNV